MRTATRRDSSVLPVVSTPRFVGRDRDLAALSEALTESPAAVVLVAGEAGIGKSRLVREYLASPAGQEQRSLVACCPPFHQPCTLGPVVDALRLAAGNVSRLGLSGLAGALRPLLPEWAGVLPPLPEPLEDAGAARYRVYRALAEVLDGLGVRLVVAEDVHWADETMLEFLLFLASRPHGTVSLVVTYRPEDVPEGSLLWRLSAGMTSARVTLGPLDAGATGELAASMLDGKPVSADFTAFLHQHADGLPLAVEETIRLMADRADLVLRDGGWARRHLADIVVPPTVRDAVLERVARLGPDPQAVLRAAAVLAEPATPAVLLGVSGLAGQRQEAGLAGALGSGLLAEKSRRYGLGLISFGHALTARTVYETIPLLQRRHLHQRAGRILQDNGPATAAQLARHFRAAGDAIAWQRYGEQAADLALAAGDHSTAASLLRDLVTSGALTGREAARLTAKIPVQVLDTSAAARLASALRAILEAGGITPGAEEGAVRHQLGRLLMAMEEWNDAHAELERAVPCLDGNPAGVSHAMSLLGWPIGWTDWPAARHLSWLRRAAEEHAALPPAEALAVQVNRVTALLMLGEEQGWAEAAGLLTSPHTAGERLEVTRGQLNLGNAAMLWGRYAEAERRLDTARQLADVHGFLNLRNELLVSQARLDWYRGAWDGLTARADSLAQDEPSSAMCQLELELLRGLLATVAGEVAGAEERLTRVINAARRHGSSSELFHAAAGALARLRLTENRAQEALEVTEESVEMVSRKEIWLWAAEFSPARVTALLAVGRTGEARELVAAFSRGLSGRAAPAPQAALADCRALLTEACGAPDRAARLFGRATTAWQACPRPYDTLLAQERQGTCLLAAGQEQAGLALLSQAHAGLVQLGATSDSARILPILRNHGVRAASRRAGRHSYGDQLSPRELEVVRLLVAGRSVREIAGALFLSPKTVDRHVDSARRKLKAPSRIALAATAIETGILAPGAGAETA